MMNKIVLAAAAAVLLTGSLANAQFLIVSSDNDQKQATNLWVNEVQGVARHAAPMPAGTIVSTGVAFLLGSDANDHKEVTNQYGRR